MSNLQQRLPYIRKRLEPYLKTIDEYVMSERQASYYEVLRRPKRRRGYRYIYSCRNTDIRSAHKILYELLREHQPDLHPSVHGFIKGRSTFTNALPHVEKKYILHIDIKDFFDSVMIHQVKDAFIAMDLHEDVVDFLSKLTTVDGILRQGLHTSPDISNHCLNNIDRRLSSYATAQNLIYTRYGDDITLSGDIEPSATDITAIIEADGFVVNKDKVKVQKRGANQYVTGLSVFDKNPRIPRSFKKRLRSALYHIDKYGFEDHIERTRARPREDFGSEEDYQHHLEGLFHGSANYITGHVGYVNSVEKERARKMWDVLNEQKIRDYQ